jgi:protein-S-isoprenylcysteine O-methyltransferase Ste14
MADAPWWRGTRGEWFVVAQFLLLALIAVGPTTWRGWPSLPFPGGRWVSLLGVGLLIGAACLGAAAVAKLGDALTPLPCPSPTAVLRETGVYRLVRHPMYSSVIVAALGWALFRRGWLTLGYALLGWAFLEVKVRREEKWLLARFPGYADYRRRVRKFIPFVY